MDETSRSSGYNPEVKENREAWDNWMKPCEQNILIFIITLAPLVTLGRLCLSLSLSPKCKWSTVPFLHPLLTMLKVYLHLSFSISPLDKV